MNNLKLIQDKFLEKNAIITNDKIYTYRELTEKSREFETIIEKGSLVLCKNKSSFESIAFYVASLSKGFKCILMSPDTNALTTKEIQHRYKAEYIVTENTQSERIEILRMKNSESKIANNIALLMPTSGSTGSPKMVIQTYKNIYSNMLSILEYLPINENDRMITNLPMFYTYGLSCINTHLHAGAEIIVENRSITTRGFWETYAKYKPTSFSGVPYNYEVINRLGMDLLFTNELKYITQAGGKMSIELTKSIAERAEQRGTSVYIMYGQTEATARMAYLPPEELTRKIGSIGKAIPGGEINISKNDRYIYNGHECGELEYTGNNVTPGYAQTRKDLISEATDKNILKTGDIGYKDKDGFYYIIARKSRIAKINGERIDLDYISNAIENIVKCNCAVITNDRILGVFLENGDHDTRKLKEFLKSQYGIKTRDIKIKTMSYLPRTQTGKINYKELVIE